ncbi:MAG: hypothetical protein HFE94_08440 [Acutalibacter sp.]|nr:hypothetical protein [Acutalibacter sp.]
MKMFGYFQMLSLAARWFLPQEEAREMMEDYREILNEAGEEQARQRFGPPQKAVLAAADRRQVVIWHLLLAGILLLIFFPAHWVMNSCYYSIEALVMAAVAAGTLLFWFGVERPLRPFYQKNKLLLAVAVVMAVLVALFCGSMFFLPSIVTSAIHPDAVWIVQDVLRTSVPVLSLLSFGFVLLAKLFHRGWRAVAILCMTLVCLSINVMSILGYMGPTTLPDFQEAGFLLSFFNYYTNAGSVDLMGLMYDSASSSLFIGAAGILVAGVGLC